MSGAGAVAVRAVMIAGMAASVLGLMRLFADGHRPQTPADDAVARMAEAWSGEIRFGAGYAALDPAQASQAVAPGPVFDPSDDYWGLPRRPGFDEVAARCAACHSLALVMQQRQNAAGWAAVIDRMTTRQGMPAPNPQTQAVLIAYLTREFGWE